MWLYFVIWTIVSYIDYGGYGVIQSEQRKRYFDNKNDAIAFYNFATIKMKGDSIRLAVMASKRKLKLKDSLMVYPIVKEVKKVDSIFVFYNKKDSSYLPQPILNSDK